METCLNLSHCVSYILATNEYFSIAFSCVRHFLLCSTAFTSSRTAWLCPQPAARCSACCGTWSEPQNIPHFIQRDTPGSSGRRTSLIPTLKFMTDGAPCMSFQVPSAYMAKGRGELELCLLWGFSYQYTRRVFFPSNSPITTEFQNIRLSCPGWVDLTVPNTFLPSSPLGLIQCGQCCQPSAPSLWLCLS